MSGDVGLHEDNAIIFYSKEMTATKLVVLMHKGIKLNYKLKDTELNTLIDNV